MFHKLLMFFIVISVSYGHSWVERLMVVGPYGLFTGHPGYPRGMVARTPNFKDEAMQYLLPPSDGRCTAHIKPSDYICKETQRTSNYSSMYPELHVDKGDIITLQYQENGHITLPQNTPQKSNTGYVWIYGTSWPSPEDRIQSIHKVWNEEGTGGDRRGKLLAIRPFDDVRCYQRNNGTISRQRQKEFPKSSKPPQYGDLWCQSIIRLPYDVEEQYTLYWVWDWPSKPTAEYPYGQTEIYTTCIDLKVNDVTRVGSITYTEGQDLNSAAVESQLYDYD